MTPETTEVARLDAERLDAAMTETSSPDPGSSARVPGRLARLTPWALGVLLVLALVVAVISTVQWRTLAGAENERAEIERTAATFVLTLTTWDATEGMAATREQLLEAGTERFAGEVDDLFGTTEDLAGLEDIAAVSQGELQRAFVQEVDDDRALALVVAAQRMTADVLDREDLALRYAEVTLARSGDRWLVDDVELLVDVADPQPDALPTNEPGDDASVPEEGEG